MTRIETTLHQFMVIALVGILWPGAADALTMWNDQGSCFDTTIDVAAETEAASTSVEIAASLEEVEALDAGCDGADPDDSSFNVCFEDAEGPVSTFPQLIAELRAQRITDSIARSAEALSESFEAVAPAAVSDALAVQDEPILIPLEDPESECSSYPEECRAMPPLPALIVVDASSLSVPIPRVDFEYPEPPLIPNDSNATPFEGLGPADGFASELEEPPQVA